MIVRFQPGPDRWRLGFKPAVLAAFGFLEEMGFRVVRAEDTFVRYESSAVFLNVYHGRGSYELGVEIDLVQRSAGAAEQWQGHDLLDLAGASPATCEPHGWAATRPVVVQKFVAELADRLKTVPHELLAGSSDAWAKIEAERAARICAATRLTATEAARDAAERARIAHDWAGVARAYAAITSDLTPLEQRRLHFARKMLGQPSAGHE